MLEEKEKGFFRNLVRTGKRKIAVGLLGLSVYTGTFMGNGGGLPLVYNHKTGSSYGLN